MSTMILGGLKRSACHEKQIVFETVRSIWLAASKPAKRSSDDYVRTVKHPFQRQHETEKQDGLRYQLADDAAKDDIRVYAWGNAEYGALGQPGFLMPTHSKRRPLLKMHKPFRLTFGEHQKVTKFACGYGFTLYATRDREKQLFGAGYNASGQLGYHRRKDGNKPLEILIQPAPIPIPIDGADEIKSLACGRAHSVVLTEKNRLFTLGNNSYGQCGRDVIHDEDYSNNQVVNEITLHTDSPMVDAVAGQDHSFVRCRDGQIYSCGWGADGQTGLGHYNNTHQFSPVGGDVKGEKIVKIACAADCVLALNEEGSVFGWGNSEYGQFGLVTEEQQLNTPTHLSLGLGKIVDIASGGTVCLALNEDGRVFVWGFGILGKGPDLSLTSRPEEIPLTLFGANSLASTDVKVEKVFAGLGHQAVITSQGDLYIWGKNRSACLGLGVEDDRYFPLKVSIGGRVSDVSLGVDHTVALVKPWSIS